MIIDTLTWYPRNSPLIVESLGGLQEILMLFELKLCADVIVGFPLGSSLVRWSWWWWWGWLQLKSSNCHTNCHCHQLNICHLKKSFPFSSSSSSPLSASSSSKIPKSHHVHHHYHPCPPPPNPPPHQQQYLRVIMWYEGWLWLEAPILFTAVTLKE